MNRAMFARVRNLAGGAARAATAGAFLAVGLATTAQAQTDKYQQMREKASDSGFQLFASPTLVLDANQYQCGLRSQGDTCSNVFNSPTGGGGFWPTGSPNQYMFNSGLQIAGIIPSDAGFAWAGDTVGAYFMDARGTQQHGEPITQIFNWLNEEDQANWPTAGSVPDFPFATAIIEDTEIYAPSLIGREFVSDQDSWVMYWDGNPAFSANRSHPMGITVEQRTLAFNSPLGAEAGIFFIYKFTNVTNNARFQRLNENQFFGGDNDLPDAGWRIDDIYVDYDADPDVTIDFDQNYSTAILPFDMGIAYNGQFNAPEFNYPGSIFFAPFFTTVPGILGVKYLKSPVDATGQEVGLTMFSVHENPSSPGAQFFDPLGVQQLWRYMSGNIRTDLGDPACTFPSNEVKQRRLCFLAQEQKDTRFFQASGPFSLDPGESQTVVVAQFAAATIETDSIVPGSDNRPGIPTLRPGCGTENIRPLEVAAGWVSTNVCPPAGEIVDQFEVEVAHTQSLLGKALVMQTIFDNLFLQPFAPAAPTFFVVPGDGQVTIVWEESATEQNGDPFFDAAGDPGSALFNPNYRRFDVEGYRIYRGTNPGNVQLIAQFDKEGSTFTDALCDTDPTFVTGQVCADTFDVDIVSPFVQFPPGGVVLLADSSTLVVDADTALATRIAGGNAQPMTNSGIPFAFVDRGVRNGFQYFYQVTAFDINSLRSGPQSLESTSSTQTAFPQKPASDLAAATFDLTLLDRAGNPLPDPVDVRPTLDPAAGTFSGPQAPTAQLTGAFLPFAPQLLVPGSYQVRIDSVVPVYYSGEYFLTITGQPGPSVVGNPDNFGLGDLFISGAAPAGSKLEIELPPINVPSDSAKRAELAAAGISAPPVSGQLTEMMTLQLVQWHSADSDWAHSVPGFWVDDPPSPDACDGGTRWFTGDNESTPDPTLGLAHGVLQDVTVIFEPMPFQSSCGGVEMADYTALDDVTYGSALHRRFMQTTWLGRRAADIKIYWGASGVDSVIDVTHNVPVPFSTHIRASYGFVTDADGDGVLTYGDFWYTRGLEKTSSIGGLSTDFPADLAAQPVLTQVDADGDLVADGPGFALYIAGEPFIFQTASVPQNTAWTYRSYAGIVSRGAGGQYSFQETPRTPAVPGLSFALTVDAPATIQPEVADLTKVHTVPDPYYAVSQFDLGPLTKRIRFVNLPARATIRIYSVSGILVDIINHDDPSGGGQATWDLRNRSNQLVASGVYFFHVSTPGGKDHVGKFTIVNFGS